MNLYSDAPKKIHIELPFTRKQLFSLRAGDEVLLSGALIVARDQAHKRFRDQLEAGAKPPVELSGQTIFYAGPTPGKHGAAVGAIGPTTASRMDPFTEAAVDLGAVAFIGKGRRSPEVRQMLKKKGAIYLSTIGGAAAYLSRHVTDAKVVCYEDLGPESVFELTVKDLPCIVDVDLHGGEWYHIAQMKYAVIR